MGTLCAAVGVVVMVMACVGIFVCICLVSGNNCILIVKHHKNHKVRMNEKSKFRKIALFHIKYEVSILMTFSLIVSSLVLLNDSYQLSLKPNRDAG